VAQPDKSNGLVFLATVPLAAVVGAFIVASVVSLFVVYANVIDRHSTALAGQAADALQFQLNQRELLLLKQIQTAATSSLLTELISSNDGTRLSLEEMRYRQLIPYAIRVRLFPLGSANMLPHTRKLLKKIGELAAKMDNKIAIEGHTDATPYKDTAGYTNWELSADRANSTRRMLQSFGVAGARVVEVIGKAARDPLIKENPRDPRNRRISITLIRKHKLRSAAVAAPAGKAVQPAAKPGEAGKK